MTLVLNNCTDPYYNMAFDEWCLEHYKDDTFFYLWRNRPSVILGCNQDVAHEIEVEYCRDKGINIVRRCTGGGAVYHDLGNINFSFIGSANNLNFVDESKHLIIKALSSFGINAITTSSNDIFVDNKKISGTAVRATKNAILFHGTLLYDLDLNEIYNISNKVTGKIIRKAVKSRPSLVANIRPLIKKDMSTEEFMLKLQDIIVHGSTNELTISKNEIEEINYIADNKYRSSEWIYSIN